MHDAAGREQKRKWAGEAATALYNMHPTPYFFAAGMRALLLVLAAA